MGKSSTTVSGHIPTCQEGLRLRFQGTVQLAQLFQRGDPHAESHSIVCPPEQRCAPPSVIKGLIHSIDNGTPRRNVVGRLAIPVGHGILDTEHGNILHQKKQGALA